MSFAGFATGAGQAIQGEQLADANGLINALNAIKVQQARTQQQAQSASGRLMPYFAGGSAAPVVPPAPQTPTGIPASPPSTGPNLQPMSNVVPQQNAQDMVTASAAPAITPTPTATPPGPAGLPQQGPQQDTKITLQGLAQAIQKMKLPPAVAWQVFENAYPKFDDQSKIQFQQLREMREQQYRQAQEKHMANQDDVAQQRADTYQERADKPPATTSKIDPVDAKNLSIAENDLRDAEAELKSVRNKFGMPGSEQTMKADDIVKASEEVRKAKKRRDDMQVKIQKKQAAVLPTPDDGKPTGTAIDAATGAAAGDGSQANPIVVSTQADIDTAKKGTWLKVDGQLYQK